MKAIFVDGRAAREPEPLATRRAVSAVMSRPVSIVDSGCSLEHALRQMVHDRVRHLAVLDDAGRYYGIVSEREISAAWADDPECLPTRKVSSIVDHEGPSVAVSATVVTAARVMREASTDAVAVVDADGQVLGMLTGTDLISLLARYNSGS